MALYHLRDKVELHPRVNPPLGIEVGGMTEVDGDDDDDTGTENNHEDPCDGLSRCLGVTCWECCLIVYWNERCPFLSVLAWIITAVVIIGLIGVEAG